MIRIDPDPITINHADEADRPGCRTPHPK